jgi:sugar-specific transcriptional regulator TrmB
MVSMEEVRALTGLGLTGSQAKVYLALVKIGQERASSIWKSFRRGGGGARQDIYRILSELQELGLVERIIAKPTEFRAVPPEECASILIQRRKDEIAELQKQASKMLQHLERTRTKETFKNEPAQYVLIPEGEALLFRLKKAIKNAQSNIDFICPREAFLKGLLWAAEVYEKALRRGVKIRWIYEKPEDLNSLPECVQALMKNPSFKLRAVPNSLNMKYWIYDTKEVFIATHPKTGVAESPVLRSNNPSLVELAYNYFEIMWITAMETSPSQH